MIRRKPSSEELEMLRSIADIQFYGKGRELIPENIYLVISPSTHRIRYILLNNKIYLSLRAGDHRFILHISSGKRLHESLEHPFLRIYVDHKYSRFVAEGGNVFTKHVVVADPNIRPNDEILVVDNDTLELLAVGKAVKPGWTIPYHGWGEAVRVREGIYR